MFAYRLSYLCHVQVIRNIHRGWILAEVAPLSFLIFQFVEFLIFTFATVVVDLYSSDYSKAGFAGVCYSVSQSGVLTKLA